MSYGHEKKKRKHMLRLKKKTTTEVIGILIDGPNNMAKTFQTFIIGKDLQLYDLYYYHFWIYLFLKHSSAHTFC